MIIVSDEGELLIGKAIQPMVERVKKFIDDGIEVRIITPRVLPDAFQVCTRW